MGDEDDLHLYVNDYEYEDEMGGHEREIDPKIVKTLGEKYVSLDLRGNISCHHLDYEEIDVFNPKTQRWIMSIKLWQMPSEMIIDQTYLDFIEYGLSKWRTIEHTEPKYGNEQWKGALEVLAR